MTAFNQWKKEFSSLHSHIVWEDLYADTKLGWKEVAFAAVRRYQANLEELASDQK